MFGTWLRDAEVGLEDIRVLMGHRERKMTDNYITEDRNIVGMQLDKIPRLNRQKSPGSNHPQGFIERGSDTNRDKFKNDHLKSVSENSQPFAISGGAEGGRTPDLLNAIQALSQLSYSPILS